MRNQSRLGRRPRPEPPWAATEIICDIYMRYSEEFVQRVLEANNLQDLISEVTRLKPARQGFMGRCPFPDHPEKTPSFSVSESKQVYHCFGCGKSGNLLTFLRDYHAMGFRQSVEFLADRARIELPKSDPEQAAVEDQGQQLKRKILAANAVARDFFVTQMNERSRSYLQARGLTEATIATFGLGFAPEGWDGLHRALERKQISLAVAETAGLLRQRREGTGHYDFFRDRVMFPIRRVSGEVIGFGGRILATGEPKYLNSPDSPVFSKGHTLYGLDQTARFIRAEDQVIIVEGYMDLLALFQAGFKNVVATLGTALTFEHALAIGRMTKNVIVLFDGDQPGQEAAEKSLPLLLSAALRPRGLVLPENLDPDEYLLARGAESLREEIQRAPDLFNQVLLHWTLQYRGTTTEKAGLMEKCQPLFEAMKDSRLRELYLADFSQRIQVNAAQIKRFFAETRSSSGSHRPTERKQIPGQVPPEERSDGEVLVNLKQAPKAERLLLCLALRSRVQLDFILQQNLLELLFHSGIKQIFQWIRDTYRQEPEKFDKLASLITTRIDDPGVVFEFDPSNDDNEELEAEVLRDCVRRIQTDAAKFAIENLRQNLKINPTREGMEKLVQLQKDRLNEYAKR
ncbi:MAG: DNA primase [Bdellovibrio sp.]|nr:MAG: DNA primase [Bdellovibrio sp.]